MSKARTDSTFKRLNRWLSLINVIVALFIFISPFLPELTLLIRRQYAEPTVYAGKLQESTQTEAVVPEENRLVIPSILLDEVIHEGPTEATLEDGVWRRPNTATPALASNTVLAGHVFTYSSPAVFYHLEKVKTGERIAVYWDKTEYLYEVTNTQTVAATAIEVEAPTDQPTLTLYTCTPLWNPVNRFIVTAKLIEVTSL